MEHIKPEDIVVPDEMRNAVREEYAVSRDWATGILQHALAWQANNPIMPTEDQVFALERGYASSALYGIAYYTTEFQKWMFLKREPETPEAVQRIFEARSKDVGDLNEIKRLMTEAYEAGKVER